MCFGDCHSPKREIFAHCKLEGVLHRGKKSHCSFLLPCVSFSKKTGPKFVDSVTSFHLMSFSLLFHVNLNIVVECVT